MKREEKIKFSWKKKCTSRAKFLKKFLQKNRTLRILSFTFLICHHLLSLDGGEGGIPEVLQWKSSYVPSYKVCAVNWWTPLRTPQKTRFNFFLQKNDAKKSSKIAQFFCFEKLTLFFPTLGSGRKNKVRPWRLVKASARLSLLKFNRTCVQKSVSGKLVCTFCECCTSVTWATKWSL